jgi:CRP-like cAMP-binding protein
MVTSNLGGDCAIRVIARKNLLDLSPLDRVGWLAGQPDDFRAAVAATARWRSYDTGQFLYHAGDAADGLYGLAEGGLELTFPLIAEEPVAIYRAEIGFWIGDNAELSETPRLVSIMASRPSRVLHWPGKAARALLAAEPRHWRSLYRLSARNTGMAIQVLSEVLALTVRARVCRRLLTLAPEKGDAPITQADLAKLVGVTRGTLQRCLGDLAARGGIETHYGRIRVVDVAVLTQFRDEQ